MSTKQLELFRIGNDRVKKRTYLIIFFMMVTPGEYYWLIQE